MGDLSETVTIKTEGHYAKQPDGFVYHYWRIVGSGTWNVQKTAMKEVPFIRVTDIQKSPAHPNTPHPKGKV